MHSDLHWCCLAALHRWPKGAGDGVGFPFGKLLRSWTTYLGLAVFFLLAGSWALAQTTSGSIAGTITDPSGAVLPGCQVTLTNLGDVDSRRTTSNESGFYRFVNVPPGNYSVTVSKAGFQSLKRSPINLPVEGSLVIDMPMQVGSESQEVAVTAESPLIEAESDSLGTVIDQRQTTELPLNGRNAMNLVTLVPSVVAQGDTGGNLTSSGDLFGIGNYQIGGGFANQSMVFLDGVPLNTLYDNVPGLIPTQDSLQEFKVDTNNLSPEYGHMAGGAINFRTKSGTQDLHGSMWEYLRNKVLNGNTFFSNQAGLARPPFTQNQYGFNLGGPVVIPHVYDGRKKTFFFVNWEGFALRQGTTYKSLVPNATERTGDLSDLGVTIYDPATTCGVAGLRACEANEPLYNRKPFDGAIIPPERQNQTALAYMKMFYPLPNVSQGQWNYITNASLGGNNYQTVVHIDQNVSDKQHISSRYSNWTNNQLPFDPLKTGIVSSPNQNLRTHNFVIDDTYTFNPKTVLDLRLSYQRMEFHVTPKLAGWDATTIGWPTTLASEIEFPGPMVMSIQNFDPNNTFGGASADQVINNATDNDRIAGSLTRFLGNHTLTFGGSFERGTYNFVQLNDSSGAFSFDQGFTQINPHPSAEQVTAGQGGAGLASFLLGYPDYGDIEKAIEVAGEQLYPAVYFNDDWRARHNLTLHLGLRWEDGLPWTERHDRQSYFDAETPNPILSAAGVGSYPGAVELVASSTRSSRYNTNNSLTEFSPRVGLSYQIRPNTVFTAGYGILWLPTDIVFGLAANDDQINTIATSYVVSTDGGLTPAHDISNPYPGGITNPPARDPIFQYVQLGNSLEEAFPDYPYPYAQQWNVGIQQQLGRSFALNVAYGGAKGTHLPFYTHQMDQLPDQYLSMGADLNTQVANPFYGVINPNYGLGASTISKGQLLRPFPQYNGVQKYGASEAASSYNSLQVTAQKRFSNGASINAAYTFAKLISNTDTMTAWTEPAVAGAYGGMQDSNNTKAERSLSNNDVKHHLVLSYIYDFPIGRGERYLSNAPKPVDYILGHWGVGGTTTLQDGFPIGFGTNQNLTNSFGGGSRPNVVQGCRKSVSGSAVRRLSEWFNTACFTQPDPYTFGNESRLDPELRTPGIANWDASLFKRFPFGTDAKRFFEFRAEAFNLFNRVQFGYPNATQGSTTFGQINSQRNSPRLVQFGLRVDY